MKSKSKPHDTTYSKTQTESQLGETSCPGKERPHQRETEAVIQKTPTPNSRRALHHLGTAPESLSGHCQVSPAPGTQPARTQKLPVTTAGAAQSQGDASPPQRQRRVASHTQGPQ